MSLSDWQPIPIVATGDLWTAAEHNTYIRNNQQIFYAAFTAGHGSGSNVDMVDGHHASEFATEDKIDDRFRAAAPLTSGDFNDYVDPGVSHYLLRGDLANAPPGATSSTWWYVLNYRFADRVLQYAMPYRATAAKRIWMRTYYPTAWTDWYQLWTGNDVQRITGDGECRRYPDGLQICWAVVDVTGGTNYEWTWPAAFADIPSVSGHAYRDTTFHVYYVVSATKVTWRTTSSIGGHKAYLMAVGRWK